MTKHRLMLSAATAALLAAPLLVTAARADTTISGSRKTAIDTATDGNITIDTSGGVEIKSANPAVTLNSNNSITSQGAVSNDDATGAVGYAIDTTGGNIVSPSYGLNNIGSLDVSGNGTGKTAILVSGGHIYFGQINFSPVIANTVGSGTTLTGSGIQVEGANSNIFAITQGTTIDGDVLLGGTMTQGPGKQEAGISNIGSTAMDLEGTINGDFQFATNSSANLIGNQIRGIAILGGIGACDTAAETGAGSTSCTTSTGNFRNSGTINLSGTDNPSRRGHNVESGSGVVIGSSIAGGFLNNGPSTSNGNIATASIIASGDVISGSSIFSPTVLIDPSQSITATQTSVRGPAILGPIAASIDAIDPGYSVINRGTISGQPIDPDINSVAMAILGASATDNTYLSATPYSTANPNGTGATPGAINTSPTGLLDTGSIVARSYTGENTTSNTSANAILVGSFATIPRLVVSGELISGSTNTPGLVNATVAGPGGGFATAIDVANAALVPQIDVLAHGTISATITTSTLSPNSDDATSLQPFSQEAVAILDQSGTLKFINNAGTIAATTTTQTPAADANVVNISEAINLLAGTSGGATVNNSGIIEGDVLFNAGGGGNTLLVGNTGTGAGDHSGNANATIATLQGGTATTNTPFAYASVSGLLDGTPSGLPPVTEINTINFGAGTGNTLDVGGFGYVNSVIQAAPGGLDVEVENNGQLFISTNPDVPTLNARNFDINGGVLGLSITQQATTGTPVVLATNSATLDPSARLGLQFGTFISSGTSTASINHPTSQAVTLISAPAAGFHITQSTVDADNALLATEIPFLFESPGESHSQAPQPLSLGTAAGGNDTLLMTLLPRSPGATNADGTAGLGLSGDAAALFPHVAAALANDPKLGAAIANNLSIYNSSAVGVSSGLNIAASQQKAQQVFSQFTPDVSGGTRQVAIMITDQETGPVAARQRLLRNYANQQGQLTLWGEEFAGSINNKGRVDADGALTNYKDHGFGFVLGMDAGSAQNGWYGGALTYYSGDVVESLPRSSKTKEQWYMLTGYTDWRGRHVFLDTTGSLGYGNLLGNRTLTIGDQARDAIGKRAAFLGAAGATGGVNYTYGLLQIMPHIGLDGLLSREEGYTESGGGSGFDLQVAPYYANSLRTSIGSDFKVNLNVFGVDLSPEARLGYRYDFINTPVKLRAAFASTGGLNTPGNSFTFVGPDPDTGNAVAGLTLGAGTDTWSLGINYDWIRGNNGSTTQVGTFTLLGRI